MMDIDQVRESLCLASNAEAIAYIAREVEDDADVLQLLHALTAELGKPYPAGIKDPMRIIGMLSHPETILIEGTRASIDGKHWFAAESALGAAIGLLATSGAASANCPRAATQ